MKDQKMSERHRCAIIVEKAEPSTMSKHRSDSIIMLGVSSLLALGLVWFKLLVKLLNVKMADVTNVDAIWKGTEAGTVC